MHTATDCISPTTSDDIELMIKQSNLDELQPVDASLESIINQLSSQTNEKKERSTPDDACNLSKMIKVDDSVESDVEYPYIDKVSFVNDDYSTNTDQWMKKKPRLS